MEPGISQKPYSPSSQPPENSPNNLYNNFSSAENHLETPLIANHGAADQAIESALSKLTLSRDFSADVKTLPQYLVLPATLGGVMSAESFSLPMDFGKKPQPLVWAQTHNNNGGVNGPFGFVGAHQNNHVVPEPMNSFGRGPSINAGELIKYPKRQDFWDGTCNGHDCASFLHGKKPFSREARNHVPIVTSSVESNICSLDCNNVKHFYSPRSTFYSNQHFSHEQQELTFDNMRGRIVSLAQDQPWSGVLKLKLEGLSEEEIGVVLLEVMEFLCDLMRNQFGCEFVQKLFVVCNEDQRLRIILAITKFPFKLISICLNLYGAKAMQMLLEKLITPQQISVVISAVSLGAIALANDPNGQHVIQYCVKHFPGEYNKHLFNAIAENCFKVATNKSGCCVLQSCVDCSHGEARERLLSVIIANAVHLAEDPYGNYVVQHLLGMKMPEVTVALLRRFRGYFASLSCNKYASNVVEKFLLESGEKNSTSIIIELLSSPNGPMLLFDPYGNFVIQSALSMAKGHVLDALLKFIGVYAPVMKRNQYGKKVLAWFEKEEALKRMDV